MQPKDVTESATTTSSAVELQIDLTKCTDKLQAVQLVEAIQNYLQTTETNPLG